MGQLVMSRFEAQVQDLSLNIRKKVLTGFAFALLSIGLGLIFYYYFGKSIEGVLLGILIGRLY